MSSMEKTDIPKSNKTLANTLLTEIGIIRSIVDFTSVPQTARLLLTCEDLHTIPQTEIFGNYNLPTTCDLTEGDGLMLYHAMVAENSPWLELFGTDGVKQLKLPISMTDEEMLRLFVNGKFSQLQLLSLHGCQNIIGNSLAQVGQNCTNLQSLDLHSCYNVTDVGFVKVAQGCPNLQSVNLFACMNITSLSLEELALKCPKLRSLSLATCGKMSEASVTNVLVQCTNLQSLDLRYCRNITPAFQYNLGRLYPQLKVPKPSFSPFGYM